MSERDEIAVVGAKFIKWRRLWWVLCESYFRLMCVSNQHYRQHIRRTPAGNINCFLDNRSACCCSPTESEWCGCSGETWRQQGRTSVFWRSFSTGQSTSRTR